MRSCDGLFYRGVEDDDLSLLVEAKRVSKSKLMDYLIKDSKESESILGKVKESVALIKNDLEFNGGFTGKELVRHLHFVMIYTKNDRVSLAPTRKMDKRNVSKDSSGRQNRAARGLTFKTLLSSSKKDQDIFKKLSEEMEKIGFAKTKEDYFGISGIDPEASKLKGRGKARAFSMITEYDLKQIIEQGFFENWKWGEYKEFLNWVPVTGNCLASTLHRT